MYTLDYIKSLLIDLEVWDSPGSRFGDEDHFELEKYFTDEELEPMTEYDEPDELMDTINRREHGLALYVFTKNKKWAKKVMSTQQYGGGCVNEVCLHLMVKGAPFNGTGHSGMGSYHGIWGFREFTHQSTVLFGSNHFNLPMREHPYSGKTGEKKRKLLNLFLK